MTAVFCREVQEVGSGRASRITVLVFIMKESRKVATVNCRAACISSVSLIDNAWPDKASQTNKQQSNNNMLFHGKALEG